MEKLKGEVRRVAFSNPETGFAVAEVEVNGEILPATIVGNIGDVFAGQTIEVQGKWEIHPKFGRRFRVESYQKELPHGRRAIIKYLRSGLIEGIGPVLAEKIVAKFGDQALEVIDKRPQELLRVHGVGKKRLEMIKRAWEEQKEISSLMVLLKDHDLGTAVATKIIRKYGHKAMAVITKNPYRLAQVIHGIGFKTADKIAFRMGFEKSSTQRLEAGIVFRLSAAADQGHVFYPLDLLVKSASGFLEVTNEQVLSAIDSLAQRQEIVIENYNEKRTRQKAVFLRKYHSAETGVAQHMDRLLRSRASGSEIATDKALLWLKTKINIRFAPRQIEAIKHALMDKVLIITGGPGTGKTTIVKAIIEIFKVKGALIELAAPTGRAAQRLAEATSMQARTIHRLLEFSWEGGGFQRNEQRPLDADLVIVDEASMIDISLMAHLLRAIPSEARLILVGDMDQLPSVGPGNVLKDLVDSAKVPVVRLTEIFRQARQSMITVNAHRINSGKMPLPVPEGKGPGDFYFIERSDPELVLKTVLELVQRRIPKRFSLDPLRDVQVLCPMHKGLAGTEELNRRLQQILNPSGSRILKASRRIGPGDKVMQIRNDYEKEVFNGDIGFVKSVDTVTGELVVSFEGKEVLYKPADLEDLTLAYAISVHKSQGSEYPAVVFPILSQHHLLLQRNLVYTAVTRARRLLVMVGSREAVARAIANKRPSSRFTLLAKRLKEL